MNENIYYDHSGKELTGPITFIPSAENGSFELYINGERVRSISERPVDKSSVKTVRLTRNIYDDGKESRFYGLEINDSFHEIFLKEPFRPSFQPFGRFFVMSPHRKYTEHRIIIDNKREALLEVNDDGRIQRVSYRGKDLNEFEVPVNHEFFNFVYVMHTITHLL